MGDGNTNRVLVEKLDKLLDFHTKQGGWKCQELGQFKLHEDKMEK